MRAVSAGIILAAAVLSLHGCGAGDKVLTPDDPVDAGMDATPGGDGDTMMHGDGDHTNPGDGDKTPGDGDKTPGDGDKTPGDGDAAAGDGDKTPGDGDATPGDGDSTGGAKDADCDMNGIWIARQNTDSVDTIFNGDQYANQWLYMEFTQTGEDVTIAKNFDCGVKVLGSVTVAVSKATLDALLVHNSMTGRKGKAYKDGSSCHFELERWWKVRGAKASFIPDPANSKDTVSAVAGKNPLPTKDDTTGAEDWENDGQPGSAWQISGIASGTRNSVQRDYTEYFSDASHPFPASKNWTSNIGLRANFDGEENILNASSSLVGAGSKPKAGAQHTITLQFLGRDASDSRAKAIIKDTNADTCFAIQAALPAQKSL